VFTTSFVIEATIDTFNETDFKHTLAASLGVRASAVTLSVAAASITVTASVRVPARRVVDIRETLESFARDPAAATATLGVPVLSATPPIEEPVAAPIVETYPRPPARPPPASPPPRPPSPSGSTVAIGGGDTTGGTAALTTSGGDSDALLLPVVAGTVVILAGVIISCGVCWRRQQRQKQRAITRSALDGFYSSSTTAAAVTTVHDMPTGLSDKLGALSPADAGLAFAVQGDQVNVGQANTSSAASTWLASASSSCSEHQLEDLELGWVDEDETDDKLDAPIQARPSAAEAEANAQEARVVSPAELEAATDQFAACRELGRGGFGKVYIAATSHMPSLGSAPGMCGVKRLSASSSQGMRELLNEIQILGCCKHESLLPLLRFCLDSRLQALLYPLMRGGNLEDRLLATSEARRRLDVLTRVGEAAAPSSSSGASAEGAVEPMARLSWQQRLRVVRDVSRALLFLHTPSKSRAAILHRDIKATNILLDEHCNAKLADVGMARSLPGLVSAGDDPPRDVVTHVSTLSLLGTPGYVDPAVFNTGQYSPATDGYALGKVMLMCLTGLDVMAASEAGEDIYEDEACAFEHADTTVEWPPDAPASAGSPPEQAVPSLVAVLAGVICGLVYLPRRKRPGLAQVLKRLEDISERLRMRPGVVMASSCSERDECVVCMSLPRAVRFACGHCTCCENCTDALLQLSNQALCPCCRTPIHVLTRGLDTAASSDRSTFLFTESAPQAQWDFGK